MPHVPDRHTDHDLALVAAAVDDPAGELTDAQRATLAELLAACAECRRLQVDLRALAAATAALPAPPRRRDYRITAGQAARLRPTGLRGILATLASSRFSFAAPVGTALATLGLVGLLVASIPGPQLVGTAGAPGGEAGAGAAALPAPAQRESPPAGADTQGEPGDVAIPYAESAPDPGSARLNGGSESVADAAAGALAVDAILASVGWAALLTGAALVALRLVGRRFG